MPLDLRKKQTRAIRRRLTHAQKTKLTQKAKVRRWKWQDVPRCFEMTKDSSEQVPAEFLRVTSLHSAEFSGRRCLRAGGDRNERVERGRATSLRISASSACSGDWTPGLAQVKKQNFPMRRFAVAA